MKINQYKCKDCDAQFQQLEGLESQCPGCEGKNLDLEKSEEFQGGCGGGCGGCHGCE